MSDPLDISKPSTELLRRAKGMQCCDAQIDGTFGALQAELHKALAQIEALQKGSADDNGVPPRE